jgi:hypothetical protein
MILAKVRRRILIQIKISPTTSRQFRLAAKRLHPHAVANTACGGDELGMNSPETAVNAGSVRLVSRWTDKVWSQME